MRYVSIFSGVEAATVAWSHLGWEPLAFAEVDEFPSAVLAYRFPNVPNLGDVCNIDWEEFYGRHGAVDVLIGGSPCQSFSIAGGREGLKGESRLMFEYIRAIRDLVRASGGKSPRYIVWENVPGCLSSNKGRDFKCLLDELEDCGYFVCWRTLDSQFARVFDRASGRFRGPVPQRRRRVFLVGSLGGPSAADILFERQSMLGNHPSSREAREAFARDSKGGAGMGDSAGTGAITQDGENISRTITARMDGSPSVEGRGPSVIAQKAAGFKFHQGSGAGNIGYGDVSPTLATDWHVPGVMAVMTTANTNANGSNVNQDGVSYTLDGTNSNAVAFTQNQRDEVRLEGLDGSIVGSLHTGSGKNDHFVMSQFGDVAGTLTAMEECADRVQNIDAITDYSDADDNDTLCFEECVSGSATHHNCAPTIRRSHYKQPPVVCMGSQQGRAAIYEDVCPTVASAAGTSGNNQPVICMESAQSRAGMEVGMSPTLNASHEQPIVCAADDNGKTAIEEDLCGSLKVGGVSRE